MQYTFANINQAIGIEIEVVEHITISLFMLRIKM